MMQPILVEKSDWEALNARLDRQDFMLFRLLKSSKPVDFLTVQDIADMMQIDISLLYKKPWMLPNYGKSDLLDVPLRFKVSSYLGWIAVPMNEHKRVWDTMSEEERREVQNIVAA